ncbi:hypothetical protein BAUCODRAFT_199614 [Baudoinia panamericana UAMH 10762]|uniref:Uncharacterized protein n=1 Tax=Baudoinia panamericana (strain UAMH 10762) TaxID=717646 RepID=M2M245_BAUPA|nr:uncharacterized protein BAUCODRAFT_199614 [Baudoinia panamericana UAMH 10762]EMD01158.1 hypothetical protein BAUCODRAFT_199614 [Baudoinia panamericana UAMH 10762]
MYQITHEDMSVALYLAIAFLAMLISLAWVTSPLLQDAYFPLDHLEQHTAYGDPSTWEANAGQNTDDATNHDNAHRDGADHSETGDQRHAEGPSTEGPGVIADGQPHAGELMIVGPITVVSFPPTEIETSALEFLKRDEEVSRLTNIDKTQARKIKKLDDVVNYWETNDRALRKLIDRTQHHNVAKLEWTVITLQKRNGALIQRLLHRKKQCSRAKSASKIVVKEVKRLCQEFAEARRENREATVEAKKERDQAIEEAREAKAEAERSLEALRRYEAELVAKTGTDELEKRNAAARTDIDELRKRNAEAQTHITDLQKRSTAAQTSVQELQKRNAATIQDLQKRKADLEKHLNEVKKRDAAAQTGIEDLQKRNADLQKHLDEVKKQYSQAEAASVSNAKDNRRLNNEVAGAKKDRDDAMEEARKAKAEVQKHLKALQDRVAEALAQANLAKLQKQNVDQAKRLEEVQREYSKAKSAAERNAREVGVLRNDVAKLRTERNEAKEEARRGVRVLQEV